MKKTKGFGLLGVIIIIIVTSIVSALATGVIMLNNTQNKIADYSDDQELQEFIEVYETLLSKYYNEIDKKGMLNAAEEGMINFLGDKYTTYLNDKEYQNILNELSATYDGIGVEISNNVIVRVIEDSPAFVVGLKSGDIITKINGEDVTNKIGTEINNLMKNDSSNTVSLEINRNDDILNFDIEKTSLINKAVDYYVIDGTSIGYIFIRKFSENLSEQVKNALTTLESLGINSLIVDVRNNAGGYLVAAEETASLFLETGQKIYSLKTNSNEYVYRDKTREKTNYPIAVLINNNTASAAEILAAALKESYGATVVGVKSYGKGKVQQVVPLENGDSVKYTSAKWLTPNGECIDGLGLMPNIIVTDNNAQLETAIELLQ